MDIKELSAKFENFKALCNLQIDFKVIQYLEEVQQVVNYLGNRKFDNFIEIGSAYGGSLWLYSSLLTPKANITIVESNITPQLQYTIDVLRKEGKHIRVLSKFSVDAAKDVTSEADLLHIDGDHSELHTFQDFKLYYPKVRDGGVILLHDTDSSHEGPPKLRAKLEKENYHIQTFTVRKPGENEGCGISVVKKCEGFLGKLMCGRRPKANEWKWQWGTQFGQVKYLGEPNTLLHIKPMTENKRICLVGNAFSIFNNKHDIDAYDVVCRINQTFPLETTTWTPKNYKDYIGSRTDIYFSSDNKYTELVDTKCLIWLTYGYAPQVINMHNNRKPIDEWIMYGQKEWYDLENKLGNRPGSGLLALQFLKDNCNFKSLDIYGFDFWETNDWINSPQQVMNKNINIHDFNGEKDYILKLIDSDNRINLIKDIR